MMSRVSCSTAVGADLPLANASMGTPGIKTFQAAKDRSFWEALARLQLPLLVIRSGNSILVGEQEWARYKRLFPHARLVEFDDSPHDIFRPDRGRYPRLVKEHVDRADGDR